MASKKKEEQNLKTLRELISHPHNKQCLECHQKGPTYVDMTTCGFICTQCSGYLRGINPPHRVKSVSMTTFSEAELDKLRNGGNEFAQQVWMGTWSRRDREPDKKDERAFKAFLQDKYERKRWYRDPSEVRREKEASGSNTEMTSTSTDSNTVVSKPATLLVQPPSFKSRSRGDQQQTKSSTPNSTHSTPAAEAAGRSPPAVETAQKPKGIVNLLDNDPFTPQAPTGGVAVLPQIPPNPSPFAPTSSSSQANDFGAFTSAAPPTAAPALLQPLGSGSTSSLGSGSAPPSAFPTVSGAGISSVPQGDRYAALASLDQTLKDIKLKEDEHHHHHQHQQQQQQQMAAAAAAANSAQVSQKGFQQQGPSPLQKRESNPFLMGGPPITGPPKSQAGFGVGQQAAGGFGIAPQAGFGMGPQGGGFGMGPQAGGFGMGTQAGGFGMGTQAGGFGMGLQAGGYSVSPQGGSFGAVSQAGFGGVVQPGFGARPQMAQPSAYMAAAGGGGGPQAGFGAFVGASQPMGQPQQFGGAFNQGQWGGGAQPQWAAAAAAQTMGQFPANQQAGFPGQPFPGGTGAGMMMPQTSQMAYTNFSGGQMTATSPQLQQQTPPPHKPLPQFDWSSAPGNKPPQPAGSGSNSLTGSASSSSASLGWSNNLSKPAPSSIWDQAQQKPAEPQQQPLMAAPPGSWSSNLLSSGSSMGSGTSMGAGQSTGFGQAVAAPQSSPNPFGSSTGGGNPFL